MESLCNIDTHITAHLKIPHNLWHKIHAIKCFIHSFLHLFSPHPCWARGAAYFTMHTSAGQLSTPRYKYITSLHNARENRLCNQILSRREEYTLCWVLCVSACRGHSSGLDSDQSENKVKMQTLNYIYLAMILAGGDEFSRSIGENI